MKELEKTIENILDKHAEYYIRQTMKFFSENGESPALSKNNTGDLAAKKEILKSYTPKADLVEYLNGLKKEPVLSKTGEDLLVGTGVLRGYNQAIDEIINYIKEKK